MRAHETLATRAPSVLDDERVLAERGPSLGNGIGLCERCPDGCHRPRLLDAARRSRASRPCSLSSVSRGAGVHVVLRRRGDIP